MRTPWGRSLLESGAKSPGIPVSGSYGKASITRLIKIQCASSCGKIRAEDGFLRWGPRGCC